MGIPVRTLRRETGLVEGICEHGVGHPIWGSADWMALYFGHPRDDNPWLVHGCDGCCSDQEWELTTMRNSTKIANEIIMAYKKRLEQLDGFLDAND